jgi:predicted ester cyclase
MAMAFTFQVLDNSARNYILSINGVDVSTTVAATAYTTQSGIIAANGYTPTTSFKIRRVVYNTTNCVARFQWHATSNVDFLALSGYGNFDLWNTPSLINSKATGATGDIDMIASTIAAVTTGGGATASLQIVIEAIKGFK